MQMNGKILFYNNLDGSGIIITKEKKKLSFSIQEWDDFDIMPSLGLSVSFEFIEEQVKNIKANETAKEETVTQEKVVKQEETATQEEAVKQEKTKENNDSNIKKTETKSTKQTTSVRYKNQNLEKLSEELNALLNDSSDNLDILDAQISLSMDIADTMHQYFENLNKETAKRIGYKKVNGRLDYSLAKRFLWTTFNNLTDIDNAIVTLRIGSISQDLKFMSKLKDDFDKKVRYPLVAFEDIFLKSQQEYILVKQMTSEVTERLNLLKSKEEKLSIEKEKKKQKLTTLRNKETRQHVMKEFKTLNGTYVDVVHMMAKLQEIHAKNTKRLSEFEQAYKESFYKKFQQKAIKHQKNLIEILDAQAFLLDSLLWKEAKTSEAILAYFRELSINIELNTKTYLKYYLETLDEGKVNNETKELFKFYDYLKKHQKNYVLILTADVQNALDYTQFLRSANKSVCIKSFISELESIKWAMSNTVKIIILEDTLASTNAQQYLDYYHTHMLSKPKIILIGDQKAVKSSQYSIHSVLPKHIQPKKLNDTLSLLL